MLMRGVWSHFALGPVVGGKRDGVWQDPMQNAATALPTRPPVSGVIPLSSLNTGRAPEDVPSCLISKPDSLLGRVKSKLWLEQWELGAHSGVKEDRKYIQILLLCALIHSDSYKKALYGSSHITSQHDACHHGETHRAMVWKWWLLSTFPR